MEKELIDDADNRMEGAITALDSDLAGYRTGRASPRLLDQIVVEMYGVEMSLPQMAVVSVPEPQQLAIRPFDATAVSAIERAIIKSDLGLNPNSDGKIIYLNLPRLNEERRRDLTRMVNRRLEDAKVAVRNVRRDVLRDLKEMESEKMITEDELKRAQEKVQKMTDAYTAKIDELGEAKEKEIMDV